MISDVQIGPDVRRHVPEVVLGAALAQLHPQGRCQDCGHQIHQEPASLMVRTSPTRVLAAVRHRSCGPSVHVPAAAAPPWPHEGYAVLPALIGDGRDRQAVVLLNPTTEQVTFSRTRHPSRPRYVARAWAHWQMAGLSPLNAGPDPYPDPQECLHDDEVREALALPDPGRPWARQEAGRLSVHTAVRTWRCGPLPGPLPPRLLLVVAFHTSVAEVLTRTSSWAEVLSSGPCLAGELPLHGPARPRRPGRTSAP